MLRSHMVTTLVVFSGVFVLVAVAVLYAFVVYPKNQLLREESFVIGENTFSVEIADTFASRARGLSGRDGLSDGRGMLFLFEKPGRYGFWMKDMKFPIDIVWIRSGVVVGISENLPPAKSVLNMPVYYPPEHVDSALELNAGTVSEFQIKAGDRADGASASAGSGASCRFGYCEPTKPAS